MNLVVRPPVSPEDDLDGLLCAFYKAQLPTPWPEPRALEVPTEPSPATLPGFSPWRSRLALAASVALLLSGSLFLPVRSPTDSGSGDELRGLPHEADLRVDPLWPRKEHTKSEGHGLTQENALEGHLSLEQPKDGPTAIKIEFELPPSK